MIICEGLDGSGKTTLAKRLATDLELIYINSRIKPKNFSDLDRLVFNFTELSMNLPTVFDRWSPISEAVYGKVLRQANWHVPEEFAQLHDYMVKANPLIIYCRPPFKLICDWKEEQMEGVKENARALFKAYDAEMKKVGQHLPICQYDFERHSYPKLLSTITTHLQGAIH